MNDINNQTSILTLFPQSPTTLLTNREMKLKILQLLNFFVSEIMESLRLFYIEKRFDCFDPHVGDTLCQIRAYQILKIAKNFAQKNEACSLQLHQTLSQLEIFQKAAQDLLQEFEENLLSPKSHARFDTRGTLQEFLLSKNLLLSLPEEYLYLTQCKILTTYNEKDLLPSQLSLMYKNVKQEIGVVKIKTSKILHHLQNNIAKISCEFLHHLVRRQSHHKTLATLLPYLQLTDRCGRAVLPNLPGMQILLEDLLTEQQPILFVVHRRSPHTADTLSLLFTPNTAQGQMELIRAFSFTDIQKPALIVEGNTIYQEEMESYEHFIQRFLKRGALTILLANLAKHPQYAAEELAVFGENPYRALDHSTALQTSARLHEKTLLIMQTLATEAGCTLENPSLFVATHIFCDTIQNHMEINLPFTNTSSKKALPKLAYFPPLSAAASLPSLLVPT